MNNRAYEIALNSKCDGYQRGLAILVNSFLDKKTGSWANVNEMLAQELNKPIIKKFKRGKKYSRFKIMFGKHI